MSREYWLKQGDKPLFEDLVWSRPENKAHAGKLLIIGGNLHGFASPAEAYEESLKAGIGVSRVILPDRLQKTVGRIFEAGEYAPSTPSGSFATQALAELLDLSAWADGVLLASNFGRNSETAILLEQFIEKYTGPLTLTGDALDYFLGQPEKLLARTNTLLVPSFAQLQKLAAAAHFTEAFTSDMGLLKLVDILHEFTAKHQANIILDHDNTLTAATKGKVCTTDKKQKQLSQTKIAAFTTTWWLQNTNKPLEAYTCALHEIN